MTQWRGRIASCKKTAPHALVEGVVLAFEPVGRTRSSIGSLARNRDRNVEHEGYVGLESAGRQPRKGRRRNVRSRPRPYP